MTAIELREVSKVYGGADGERAVSELSLQINSGEFLVIVGPSGCGKSTTLRMLAGLEAVTAGAIYFDDEPVHELGPAARDVAMVFQNYALYPQMTARRNIGYGLKHAMGVPKDERERRIEQVATTLDIESILDRRPGELSGGQKQRVALGRAIVREPSVFLLDEPLSNLDAKLRSEMRHEIQTLHRRLETTTVYVTHDQKEAMTMADRIAVMRDGVLQQVGPPEQLYDDPTNLFVATFLGSPSMNTFAVNTHQESDRIVLSQADTPIASVLEQVIDGSIPDRLVAGIRPEHLSVSSEPTSEAIEMTVGVSEYQGKTAFLHLEYGALTLTARTAPSVLPQPDESVYVSIDPVDVYLFDPETGRCVKGRSDRVRV